MNGIQASWMDADSKIETVGLPSISAKLEFVYTINQTFNSKTTDNKANLIKPA